MSSVQIQLSIKSISKEVSGCLKIISYWIPLLLFLHLRKEITKSWSHLFLSLSGWRHSARGDGTIFLKLQAVFLHLCMMLKILSYSLSQSVFFRRKMKEFLKESVCISMVGSRLWIKYIRNHFCPSKRKRLKLFMFCLAKMNGKWEVCTLKNTHV